MILDEDYYLMPWNKQGFASSDAYDIRFFLNRLTKKAALRIWRKIVEEKGNWSDPIYVLEHLAKVGGQQAVQRKADPKIWDVLTKRTERMKKASKSDNDVTHYLLTAGPNLQHLVHPKINPNALLDDEEIEAEIESEVESIPRDIQAINEDMEKELALGNLSYEGGISEERIQELNEELRNKLSEPLNAS